MLLQQFGTSSSVYTDIEMLSAYNNGISIYGLSTGFVTLNEILDSDFTSRTLLLTDILNTQSYVNNTVTQNIVVSVIISLQDNLRILQESNLDDEIIITDVVAVTIHKIEKILELINFEDIASTQITAINIISIILTLLDNINFATKEEIIEQLVVTDTIRNTYNSYVALLDNIIFAGSVPLGCNLSIIVSDAISLNAIPSISVILKSILTESMTFLGSVNFDGAEYLACVYNTQSSGISEYSNFDFNSFSWPLAAKSDGIYELTGSTQDGTPIVSSIKTGLIDFGTSLLKQVPYAYLGITQSGQAVLKVTSNNNGVSSERWYEVNPTNTVVDTSRIKLGKGVKAKYWQFELTNIDGSEFSLTSLELLPIQLKRRI